MRTQQARRDGSIDLTLPANQVVSLVVKATDQVGATQHATVYLQAVPGVFVRVYIVCAVCLLLVCVLVCAHIGVYAHVLLHAVLCTLSGACSLPTHTHTDHIVIQQGAKTAQWAKTPLPLHPLPPSPKANTDTHTYAHTYTPTHPQTVCKDYATGEFQASACT